MFRGPHIEDGDESHHDLLLKATRVMAVATSIALLAVNFLPNHQHPTDTQADTFLKGQVTPVTPEPDLAEPILQVLGLGQPTGTPTSRAAADIGQ